VKKIVLGVVMLLIGLLGLVCTACGVAFLPANGIGLIGIIPGGLALWAAVKMWKDVFESKPSPSEQPIDDDAQTK
jgi:cadmium resistance protein CadD (predicted permease)